MMNAQTVKNIPAEIAVTMLLLGRLPLTLLKVRIHAMKVKKVGRNPVLLIPGLGAYPFTMFVIKHGLRIAGYTVYDAYTLLDRTTGSFKTQGPALIELVEEISTKHSRPVDLVGWSMGGRYALRIVNQTTNLVGKIITLGSPIIDGLSISKVLEELWRIALNTARIPPELVQEEMETPVKLPGNENPLCSITADFDAVVADEVSVIPSSMTRKNSKRENVRVKKSHTSLGFSSIVLEIILDRLGQTRDNWTRYQAA